MLISHGINHYRDVSVVTCIGCDMEIYDKRLCDFCVNREYKKMKNAGWSTGQILRYIDKNWIIHTFVDKRNFALKKMI